jgi:hypothetical protein
LRTYKDLVGPTDRGAESAFSSVKGIWDRALDVYKSALHPGIQFCIYYQGNVVLDRAIGHSHGVSAGRELDSDGLLDLDAPVATYLPSFERHGKADITLAQILNHRAGIPVLPTEAFNLDVLSNMDRLREFDYVRAWHC